ncbi:MAG: hypothetical protein ACTSP9_04105 [Promethearchaeota archaeon]
MTEFEEKILSLLGTINEKLDKLLNVKAPQSSIPEIRATVKPSEVVEKQEEEEKAIEKPPVEGRRICPKCGGLAFNTVEDQSQVLFQQGGMKIYAKKYICKSCGTEA